MQCFEKEFRRNIKKCFRPMNPAVPHKKTMQETMGTNWGDTRKRNEKWRKSELLKAAFYFSNDCKNGFSNKLILYFYSLLVS